jgi:TolB-like protein
MRSFFSELKRRNVLRAGALYVGAAWALSQGLAQLLPVFDFPNWVTRWFVIAMIIGFPFAVLFSWFYEWTPQGVQRESEVAQDESIARQTGKTMDRWIIAVLILAVVLLLANTFVLHKDENAATATQALGKSIAVLPFENRSADKDNEYFASGMQDEILTRLAGIHDLKVISRTSTTKYASHPEDLRTVGQQLGVATVLEGSVQKAGESAHINVQLIDAQSDSHLWAESYDRDMKDLFGVERDVAEKVADALKATLLPSEAARISNVPTQSSEAHDNLLKGDYFANQFGIGLAKDPADAARRAEESYNAAIAADPAFALAYAKRSILKANMYWYAVDTRAQTIDAARADAGRALALQPDLPEAHVAMGFFHYWGQRDYAAALAEFAIAGSSLPNDAKLKAGLAAVHRRQGKLELSVTEFGRMEVLDPRDPGPPGELGLSLILLRRYAEAAAACKRGLALAPDNPYASIYQAAALQMSGDLATAGRVLAAVPEGYDPTGSTSLQRFNLALAMRDADAALAAVAHAPAWLVDGLYLDGSPTAMLRGQALALKGETAAAREAFVEAQQALEATIRELPGQAHHHEGNLALVLAALGQNSAALKTARRAVERLTPEQDAVVGTAHLARLAQVEAHVGDIDAALKDIEQLLALPAGHVVSAASLRSDPAWDPLRKDPRFDRLIAHAEAQNSKPHAEAKS